MGVYTNECYGITPDFADAMSQSGTVSTPAFSFLKLFISSNAQIQEILMVASWNELVLSVPGQRLSAP